MWRRTGRREDGQGSAEYLGLMLIVAVCVALGASLLPSGELPGLIQNGSSEAFCKAVPIIAVACEQEDVTATSNDDDNGGTEDNGSDGDDSSDSGDDQADQVAEEDDGDDDGDDGGGVLDGVGDFFSGAGDVISDGAGAVWDGTKQVGGVFKGIGEGGWDTVTGLWDTVTNPGETWEGIKQLWNDPVGSVGAIWDGIKDPIVEDWNNGNYGEAIGRGIFSVAEVVFGGKGLTKIGKVDNVVPGNGRDGDGGDGGNDQDNNQDDEDSGNNEDDEGVSCPRSWRGGGTAGRGAHVDLYEDPNGCPDAEERAAINRKVQRALNSSDPAKRAEGEVADSLGDNVIDFDRNVDGPNGRITQVDVETNKAIIEVTTGRVSAKKFDQLKNKLTTPEANPEGKPVILYLDNDSVPADVVDRIESETGATVVRSEQELKDTLGDLGEDVE